MFNKLITINLFIVILCGCSSAPRLVKDSGGNAYLNEKYGPVIYSDLNYYISESELNRDLKVFKEWVSSDTKLREKEKQQLLEKAKGFTFAEHGYLVYKFKLHSPVLVNQNEFRFECYDNSNSSMIQEILFVPVRVSVRYQKSIKGETYFSYIWMIKLKNPLTISTYPAGKYKFTVVFPDKSTALYEIDVK
jgi:hypothetical protein